MAEDIGYINPAGPLSVGAASGVDRGNFIRFKNIKTVTEIVSPTNVSFGDLYDWVDQYAAFGDLDGNVGGATNNRFSDLRNTLMVALIISTRSESPSTYGNANNGRINMTLYYGTRSYDTYLYNSGGNQRSVITSSHGVAIQFSGLNSGKYSIGVHPRGSFNDAVSWPLSIKIGYGGRCTISQQDDWGVGTDLVVSNNDEQHLFIGYADPAQRATIDPNL